MRERTRADRFGLGDMESMMDFQGMSSESSDHGIYHFLNRKGPNIWGESLWDLVRRGNVSCRQTVQINREKQDFCVYLLLIGLLGVL